MTLLLVALLFANGFIEPPAGSQLRRSILDGLRPAVEKQLGPDVEFKVTLIRVQGDWAFVIVDPQRKGGTPIDGWRIFGEHFGNMDGLRAEGVLRRRHGRWVLVDHAIGATDVWYCDVGPRLLKTGWGC